MIKFTLNFSCVIMSYLSTFNINIVSLQRTFKMKEKIIITFLMLIISINAFTFAQESTTWDPWAPCQVRIQFIINKF